MVPSEAEKERFIKFNSVLTNVVLFKQVNFNNLQN